jgi:hypothetical protein
MANEFIARKGIISLDGAQVTGSLSVTGNISASIFSGSFVGDGSQLTGVAGAATASYVEYTNVANKPALVSGSSQISFNGIVDKPTLVSGSSQITYSGISGIPAGIVSSSAQITGYNIFATTGSNQFNGSQAITGSLTVTGQVVAQTLNVQQVTSSIVFSSGSNIFGNSLSNTQQFTGSVSVTGSLVVNGTSAVTGTGTTNTLPKFTGESAIGNSTLQEVSGNLGLGVTPSAWSSGKALEISGFGNGFWMPNTLAQWQLNNAIFNSGFKYAYNGVASAYNSESGQHSWYTAPSGTAGNTITFTQAMTLSASGRLLIGKTNDEGFALDVVGTGRFSGQVTALNAVFGNSGGGNNVIAISNNDQSNLRLRITNTGEGGRTYSIVGGLNAVNNSSFSIFDETAGSTRFDISSTGAATFSSSVTAGGYITGQGTNPGGLGGSRYVLDWFNGMRVFSYGANSSTNGGFLFNSQRSDGTNSINYLDIASTGAATFSSSVTATNGIFSRNFTGANELEITNTSTTNNDSSLLRIKSGNTNFIIQAFNQNQVTSGTAVANSVRFYNDGAGGLSLVGDNASAPIIFYSGGAANERMRIASTGAACFACELTAKSLGTNDLILNNLNHDHANYVDGTRGSWLIQEGACDLFIINQVSCKKYKFNLIEIN